MKIRKELCLHTGMTKHCDGVWDCISCIRWWMEVIPFGHSFSCCPSLQDTPRSGTWLCTALACLHSRDILLFYHMADIATVAHSTNSMSSIYQTFYQTFVIFFFPTFCHLSSTLLMTQNPTQPNPAPSVPSAPVPSSPSPQTAHVRQADWGKCMYCIQESASYLKGVLCALLTRVKTVV